MSATILVIDDSDIIREQIVNVLKETGLFPEIYEAADGLAGFKILINNPVTLVLCDIEMPRMDGFKFISLLQTREELRGLPVILLTGREDRDCKIKGLEQGACDYVTKPFDAGELVARVKVQLKIKALQEELIKSNMLLKELSDTDPLTHLYNRRYLMESLEREVGRTTRKHEHLSLVMMDIDHFKKINDTFGHQEGDRVLVELAAFIRGFIRRYDIAARYGGEEFVVVLPETTLEHACALAERFRMGVQDIVFDGKLSGLTLTISLGVATFPAAGVDCVDSLFRQADEALYKAKMRGRNRVEVMPLQAAL